MNSSGLFSNNFSTLVTAQMHMCIQGILFLMNKNFADSKLFRMYRRCFKKIKSESNLANELKAVGESTSISGLAGVAAAV